MTFAHRSGKVPPVTAINHDDIRAFWNRFRDFAPALASNIHDGAALSELDTRIHCIHPQLSWEVGPGTTKPFQLVISPDLQRDMRNVARHVVARAPLIDDWEFHAARQPKRWDFHFTFDRDSKLGAVALDASQWTFVLLRHQDGTREVVLAAPGLPVLTDDQRRYAAAVVLESVLGEDIVLDSIDEFDLVDELEPELALKARPIRDLQSAFSTANP
jgi:hypothetical protein